jgi:hypothetical protein
MTVILNKESKNPAAKSLPRRGLNRKAKTKGSQIIGKVFISSPVLPDLILFVDSLIRLYARRSRRGFDIIPALLPELI